MKRLNSTLALCIPFCDGGGWRARLNRLRDAAARSTLPPDEVCVGELPAASWDPGRARRVAVAQATADHVVLMDADCVPRPDLFALVRRALDKERLVIGTSIIPAAANAMGRLVGRHSYREWVIATAAAETGWEKRPGDREKPPGGLRGAGALIAARRADLAQEGVLEDGRYGEEVRVLYELRERGCKFQVWPFAVAHEGWPGDGATAEDQERTTKAHRELLARYGR